LTKVLHIIGSLERGGAESILNQVANSNGLTIHSILTLGAEDNNVDRIRKSGQLVDSIHVRRNSDLNYIRDATRRAKNVLDLFKYLRQTDATVIHTWMYHSDILGGLLGFAFGKPIVWGIFLSNLSSKYYKTSTVTFIYLCGILSRFIPRKIISCTIKGTDAHCRIGYPKTKVLHIPIGFDTDVFRPDTALRKKIRRENKTSEDCFVIGMVARWDPQKDFQLLFRSFQEFLKHKPNSMLWLAGGYGIDSDNKELRELINYCHIYDRIVLLGNIGNIAMFYNGLDVFTLTSHGEGFPNVVGEAMSCGIPCIASNVGDVTHLLEDNQDHLIFSQESDELVSKWLALSNNSLLEKLDLSHHLRNRIVTHFSIDKMIEAYDKTYRAISSQDQTRIPSYSKLRRSNTTGLDQSYNDNRLIKVCHLIGTLEVGGAEKLLVDFIKRSEGTHLRNSVITILKKGALQDEISELGIETDFIAVENNVDLFFSLGKIRDLLNRFDADVLQTWMYHADLVGAIATKYKSARIPLVWSIHNGRIDSSMRFRTKIIAKVCSISSGFLPSRIVCCANSAKDNHVSFGYKDSNITVVPNGVDSERFRFCPLSRQQIRRELSIDQDVIAIGLIARYAPVKRHKLFLNSVMPILQSSSYNIHIVLVGDGCTASNQELMRLISKSDYGDNISLLGSRNDIPSLLSAIDIYVSASSVEAFPMATAEAMSVGVPCVVTSAGDSQQLLQDFGIVVDGDSPGALQTGIQRMLDEGKENWLIRGKNTRQRIKTEFSLERTINSYSDIYRNLVEAESRRTQH